MKKVLFIAAITLCISSLGLAQSAGNFNAAGTNANCAIGTGGTFNGGTGTLSLLETTIKTSSGNGVLLDVRPSLDTGLFTDTKISTTVPSASADVGIQVCVTVDGSGSAVLPESCVIYDQRFQQISSQLFSQLTACTAAPTTTACTTDADCASLGTGFTCSIPVGATSGVCVGPNPDCNFELILSTLSTHSFDFVVPVKVGTHTVRATWQTIGQTSNNDNSSVATCVGPGVLTVTQTHLFKQDGTLSF
jgi:hypothetical protein